VHKEIKGIVHTQHNILYDCVKRHCCTLCRYKIFFTLHDITQLLKNEHDDDA